MKKLFISILTLCLFASPLMVFAEAEQGSATGSIVNTSTVALNTPSGGNGGSSSSGGNGASSIPNDATGFKLESPLNVGTICGLIKKVLDAVLTLGIPVAMLFLVYAGFLFVIARGSPEGLKKARTNLVHVIIGIGIFLGAWLLGQVIANTINAVHSGTVSSTSSCN